MTFFSIILTLIIAAQNVLGINNYKAVQSSTWKQIYTADRAIDGNTGKIFFGDTCTHTDCRDRNPSWTVCLGSNQTVTSVTIHNPDRAYGRLKNIRIDVYADNPSTPGAVGQACAAISSTPVSDGISVKLDCPLGVFGRYIKISKTVTRPVWNGGWNSGWHSPSNWHSSSHSSNNPRDCDALLLCEVEIVATPIVTCPNGFQPFQNSCYNVPVAQTASWFEARTACQTIGGDLAVIESLAENNFIESLLTAGGQLYWTGLQKLADGSTWTWIDPNAVTGIPRGPPNVGATFSDWAPGEGTDIVQLNCMLFLTGNPTQWYEDECTHLHQYVCEISPTFPAMASMQCFP